MRKILLGAAALLAAALVVVACLDAGLPAADGLEPTAAQSGDGVLHLVENRWRSSRIYGGDEEGRITSVYQENRREGGQVTAITQVAAGSRGVYFIRQIYREGNMSPSDWRLCLLDPEGGVTDLGGGTELCRMRITGLSLAYGRVLVSGVTDSGNGALCAIAETGGDWTLAEEAGDGTVLSASADGDGLMLLLADGRTVRFSGSLPLAVAPLPEPQLPENISVAFKARILCKRDLLILTAICVGVLLLLVLACRWAGRARTLALYTTFVAGGCLLLTLVLVAVSLTVGGADFQAGAALEYSASLAGARAQMAARANPAAALRTDYYTSDDALRMRQAMTVDDELYAVGEDGVRVALSRRFPWGTSAGEVLDAEILALVERAAEGEAAEALLFRQGRRLAVCAVPVLSSGIPVAVLLSRTTAELSQATLTTFVTLVGVILAVMFLVALVLLYLSLRKTTKPIRALTGQMRAVSDGDLSTREMPDRRDELGDMCRAMQEMCMGLAIRDYEVDAVVRSYRRFIPKDLDRLLDRATVMEVGFGDAKTITGSVGLFTVGNREAARADLEDAGYVSFVSDSCAILRENAEAHRGRLLSASFDLGLAPVLYPASPADGLQAGLDLMGEIDRRKSSGGCTPDFFLMLHHASFLYGIAGTEEQVFPFLSSAEMEFLGKFADRFRAAGVRMVLTEPFMQRLGVGCNTRYVGFINSPDGKYTYKLHEALDTYPDIERNLRIRYDQRLQEGIRLFYQNDFYLARNIFSALLKACPRDGVARWYLFACEHYFNSNLDQLDYQLFGIDH